ncbi:MAG: DUF465 domain-containing protein [Robiginitomaculum sp.]|nr:DUF465 domain-containing protein [Robiginitomaculum sp.]MBL4616288.1 DUF465 domain-containing protein [Robiginitomaculum sp.]MCF6292988.1 DUF465 domain-containing protein [Robiginitomaculum sp.]
MSIQARIKELDNRHAKLETKITAEQKRPAFDTVYISALKKQKLALKEQLTGLKRQH